MTTISDQTKTNFLAEENEFIDSCVNKDSTILLQYQKICSSLVQSQTTWCGNSWKNVTAGESWPAQANYFKSLLSTIQNPATCLNTPIVKNTIEWLINTQLLNQYQGNFMSTWDIFQVQYFDMPRKPGNRIESPFTLGEKCWAFAFLSENWNPQALQTRISSTGLNLYPLISQYSQFIPKTIHLCNKVIANCFVNATYNPVERNGTCWFDVLKFKAGFQLENLKQGKSVKYPFY